MTRSGRCGGAAAGPLLRVVVVIRRPAGLVLVRALRPLRAAVAAVTVATVPGLWPVLRLRPGPRGARVPPAGVAGVHPAVAALAGSVLQFLVVMPPEPHAQNHGNQNHGDNSCEADYEEQDHCTTQRAMAR